jgi:aminopeptidase N
MLSRHLIAGMIILFLPVTSSSGQLLPDINDGAGICSAAKVAGTDVGTVARKYYSLVSPDIDITFYHLALDLDRLRDPILTGTVEIDGTALSEVGTFSVDLNNRMVVDSVTSLTGERLFFTHETNVLTASLRASVFPGGRTGIKVFYRGNPRMQGFGSFVWGVNIAGQPFIWSLSEPYGAKEWWPNKDNPADKADSVRVTVRSPSSMRIGSNGMLVGESDNGDGTTTYDWIHRYPISSYLISVSAGEYDVFEQEYVRPDSLALEFGPLTLPVLHYAYPGDNAFNGIDNPIPNGWKRVLEVLPVFEYWFGPYPFSREKYGHAKVTFGGGMEHQTMSSLGGIGLGLVAHELGHMWYGDAVTNRSWRDLWLHEGFATMSEMLFWESDLDQFQSSWNDSFDRYYDRALRAQGTLVLEDTTSVSNMFASTRIYSKGFMVLRMLRKVVGDTAFRRILRSFAGDPALRYATATTDDFERIAETVSGRSLAGFFEQWVYSGTGFPGYAATWSQSEMNGTYVVRVEINQTQSGNLIFDMPLDIELDTAQGPIRFTVDNNARSQSYSFSLDGPAQTILIDPDRYVLRDQNLTIVETEPDPDIPSEPSLRAHIFPNPAAESIRVRLQSNIYGSVTYRLMSITGQEVFFREGGLLMSGEHTTTLQLPDWIASGLYLLEIRLGSMIERTTLVLVR